MRGANTVSGNASSNIAFANAVAFLIVLRITLRVGSTGRGGLGTSKSN